MLNYFEKRVYTRAEIAECLELDPHDKNFARKVKTKLSNLGFAEDQYIYTSKNVTILWVPITYEEKITYLVRLLGIDKQVDPIAFSTFIYRLALNGYGDCDKMPWVEKALWLKENDGLEVSEKTLRNWTNKLLEKGILTKDTNNYQWWCSTNFEGETYRYPVDTEEDEKERREYFSYYRKIVARAAEIANSQDRSKFIFNAMWKKFHCVYYKCCSFVFCAWEENPIMKEIRDLILTHMEED